MPLSPDPNSEPASPETVAAILISAAHVHILAMQLQGKAVSIDEALTVVTRTWASLKSDQQFLSSFSATSELSKPQTMEWKPNIARAGLTEPTTPVRMATDFERRYELKRPLGKGGMGTVHLAFDSVLGHDVALKVVRDFGTRRSERALKFFQSEGRMLSMIDHPAIARFFDAGTSEDFRYISMEYVPGTTLKERIESSGPLATDDFLPIFKTICTGIASAHELGIVHRDLNPSNVMIDSDGNARVLDFGIALSTIGEGEYGDEEATGEIAPVGTVAYMAPEQLMDQSQAAPGMDVYALGLIAYEALTGTNPMKAATLPQTLVNHLELVPAPLETLVPGVSRVFSDIVAKMLIKDPDARVKTVLEVLRALV